MSFAKTVAHHLRRPILHGACPTRSQNVSHSSRMSLLRYPRAEVWSEWIYLRALWLELHRG